MEVVESYGCGGSATTGVNPDTWTDSIREVLTFFGWHVTPAKTRYIRAREAAWLLASGLFAFGADGTGALADEVAEVLV